MLFLALRFHYDPKSQCCAIDLYAVALNVTYKFSFSLNLIEVCWNSRTAAEAEEEEENPRHLIIEKQYQAQYLKWRQIQVEQQRQQMSD